MLHYDELSTRLHQKCDEVLQRELAKKKVIKHEYLPYNWPVYHSFLPKLYLSKLIYPSHCFGIGMLLLIIYLTQSSITAQQFLPLLLTLICIATPSWAALCFYPCRPKSYLYTVEYYEEKDASSLDSLMPTLLESDEMLKRIMQTYVEEVAETIVERHTVVKQRELTVDIAIPFVYKYEDLSTELDSVV